MTNPLRTVSGTSSTGKPESYIRVNDVMVPCSWDEFIDWMNAKNKRAGTWITKFIRDENGIVINRTIEWSDHVGTDAYRREQSVGQRAERAAPIQRYVTDYGRVSE